MLLKHLITWIYCESGKQVHVTEKVTLKLGPYRRLWVCACWKKAGRGLKPREGVHSRKKKETAEAEAQKERIQMWSKEIASNLSTNKNIVLHDKRQVQKEKRKWTLTLECFIYLNKEFGLQPLMTPECYLPFQLALGYPGGSDGKESACNAGYQGLIPGLGKSSGGGHGNPLQYSWLENPMDRGIWWVAKSDTIEALSPNVYKTLGCILKS